MPRDEVKILTKIWWRYDGPEDAASTRQPDRADACRATLERFRHEIDTDHLDIVLLHCCMSATWDQDLGPYRDVLSEARRRNKSAWWASRATRSRRSRRRPIARGSR